VSRDLLAAAIVLFAAVVIVLALAVERALARRAAQANTETGYTTWTADRPPSCTTAESNLDP
jgi:hypothetical protein